MFLSCQLHREAIKNVLLLICKFMLSEVLLNIHPYDVPVQVVPLNEFRRRNILKKQDFYQHSMSIVSR